jgi:NitT/TauT family transport system substrate-binding protein
MRLLQKLTITCTLLIIGTPVACGLTPITLALNWKAQPELGGFYQAFATGLYEAQGLEVTIREGGPLVNNRPLLSAGKVDFLIATNLLQAFDATRQQLPTQVVAAVFQRDPQCLIAHPNEERSWESLKESPLYMGNTGRYSFFLWMEAAHGFERSRLRPYNHNLAPFLSDKGSVVQGYATAEPMRIEEVLKERPQVFLLADHGWSSYSTLIETRRDLIAKQPELVRRFVAASAAGWREYLHGDNSAANALIQKANPTITQRQIEYSIAQMKERGLIESGDALKQGIGVIDPQRVEQHYQSLVEAGLFMSGELDPAESYTLEFLARPEPAN